MNNNEQKIEKELVEGGRYWVGLGHSFIKFPRQIQTIVFWSDYKDQRKFDDDATVVETIQARTRYIYIYIYNYSDIVKD